MTITVTNVNEPPEFPSTETGARQVDENTAAGQNIGAPFSATDPDAGETPTYSLVGTDAASFDIVATSGQLQTKAALNYEIKSTYTVTVTATDREDVSDTIEVTITVTNVNETPVVTGKSSVNYAENGVEDGSRLRRSRPGEQPNYLVPVGRRLRRLLHQQRRVAYL